MRNIERAMGMVHVIEMQRTRKTLHQLPTAKERLQRLVQQRSMISAAMQQKNTEETRKRRARVEQGDDVGDAGDGGAATAGERAPLA